MALTITASVTPEETILTLNGRIDTNTAKSLQAEIDSALPSATKLALDFSQAEYMSSMGLRVLLGTHKLCEKQGKTFVIRNVPQGTKEVLEISGFLSFLRLE
ncbi:MAG: STAS domain-containing protein [Oscillospiraceae bacterium]|jgi:anti-sigma B factor antagonist|nr:STAS domain-containing protein [Oscillospiraceae bacterium]